MKFDSDRLKEVDTIGFNTDWKLEGNGILAGIKQVGRTNVIREFNKSNSHSSLNLHLSASGTEENL